MIIILKTTNNPSGVVNHMDERLLYDEALNPARFFTDSHIFIPAR